MDRRATDAAEEGGVAVTSVVDRPLLEQMTPDQRARQRRVAIDHMAPEKRAIFVHHLAAAALKRALRTLSDDEVAALEGPGEAHGVRRD